MDSKYKIHFSYIFGILIFIVIGLFSYKTSNNSQLVTIISFAATSASLILALLAIIYAYFSNQSIATGIIKINEASNTLIKNAEEISKGMTEIKNIPKSLESTMDKKFAEIQQTANPNTSQDYPVTQTSEKKKETLDPSIVKKYLILSSLNGLSILYAVKIAFDRKIAFNMADLTKQADLDFNYCYGYLVASSALEILEINYEKEILNIIELNQTVIDEIENAFDEKIKWFKEKYPDFDIKNKEIIKKYFQPT